MSVENWARAEAERWFPHVGTLWDAQLDVFRGLFVRGAQALAERMLSDEACPTCGRIEAAPNQTRQRLPGPNPPDRH